jgi:TonB family protein
MWGGALALLLLACIRAEPPSGQKPTPAEPSAAQVSELPVALQRRQLGAAEPLEVAGGIVPPVILESAEPDLSGVVSFGARRVLIVRATITSEGDVSDVVVLRSVRPAIDDLYVAAIRRWRFQPATLHGRPVAVYYRLTANLHPR